MRTPYPYPPVTFGDSPLVGALRKHAGGMFLATDRSGYAARREVRGFCQCLNPPLGKGAFKGEILVFRAAVGFGIPDSPNVGNGLDRSELRANAQRYVAKKGIYLP